MPKNLGLALLQEEMTASHEIRSDVVLVILMAMYIIEGFECVLLVFAMMHLLLQESRLCQKRKGY